VRCVVCCVVVGGGVVLGSSSSSSSSQRKLNSMDLQSCLNREGFHISTADAAATCDER